MMAPPTDMPGMTIRLYLPDMSHYLTFEHVDQEMLKTKAFHDV